MKILLCFLFVNIGWISYSQVVRDSLFYVEQQLNLEFLIKTKELYESKMDFVMIRVSDSLSDDNDSYTYYYNKDSCTHGGTLFFDTNYVDNGSRYHLLRGGMGFAYANGDNSCVNWLVSDEKVKVMLPFFRKEDVYLKHSDLVSNDYVIYGRIGDQYIYEVFNREYALDPKNSVFQEFVNLFVYLY